MSLSAGLNVLLSMRSSSMRSRLNRIARCLCLIALLSLSIPAVGQIVVGHISLESRIDHADAVCVGSLLPFGQQLVLAKHPTKSHLYSLNVIRAYKGTTDGESVQATGPANALVAGSRYILFLVRPAKEKTFFISGFLPLPADFPLSATQSPTRSLQADLDTYLTSEADHNRERQTEMAISLLSQFDTLSPRSVDSLSSLSRHSNGCISQLSITTLLNKGIGGTRLFPRLLSRLQGFPATKCAGLPDLSYIFIQNATPQDMTQLEQLASSSNLNVRHASLRAIRKVADKSATGFLVQELDAPDTDSQYLAMISLAKLYGKGGEYGPGIGQFEMDKGKYIRLWKKWYRTAQKEAN